MSAHSLNDTYTSKSDDDHEQPERVHESLTAAGVLFSLVGVYIAFFSDTLLATVGYVATVTLVFGGIGLLLLAGRDPTTLRRLLETSGRVIETVRSTVADARSNSRSSRRSSGGRDRL
ncbi:hypothetical protein [Halorussus halophilus]|uniref:hypothetical protein n=1 Tax=Halorussus halophilus TaxID=2650975 RepID=UPI0013012ABE|nr:hypothetical protein [Halorussus halophilus]